MEDIVEGSVNIFLRAVYWLSRALLWLAWDLCVEIIGWSIGWVLFRILTLGFFPKQHITEQEKAPWFTAIFVELTGLLFLLAFVAYLGSMLGISW